MDYKTIADAIDWAGTLGLLVLIVVAFVREWVVTGVQYRRALDRTSRLEEDNRALLAALERATLAGETSARLVGGRILARQ